MRVVIQRVKEARVTVNSSVTGKIGRGALVFLGVGQGDTVKDADFLVSKVVNLRMFEDAEGKMNRSAEEVGGEFLVVSQFTLYGDCLKGRRPSFDKAAPPAQAKELYEYFVEQLRKQVQVATGEFQAMMEVSLVNDGPVTFTIDSNQVSSLN